MTVRVFSRRGTLLLRRQFHLYRGRHELGWVPPARGRFRVRVDAQGPSGPSGAAARELHVVLPKPHKKKRSDPRHGEAVTRCRTNPRAAVRRAPRAGAAAQRRGDQAARLGRVDHVVELEQRARR